VTAQILAEQQTAEEEVAKAAGAEEGLLRQLQDQIMATVSEDCDRKLHETRRRLREVHHQKHQVRSGGPVADQGLEEELRALRLFQRVQSMEDWKVATAMMTSMMMRPADDDDGRRGQATGDEALRRGRLEPECPRRAWGDDVFLG
jgi:hypothetical protein